MKTLNATNVQAMKKEIKRINELMKELLEAEELNERATTSRDYESSKTVAAVSCGEIMNHLDEMVRITSQMGESHDMYKWYELHEIVTIDTRELGK